MTGALTVTALEALAGARDMARTGAATQAIAELIVVCERFDADQATK